MLVANTLNMPKEEGAWELVLWVLRVICLKAFHSCYSSLMWPLGFPKNNKKPHWTGPALVVFPKYKGLMLDFSRLSVFIKPQWKGLMSRLLSEQCDSQGDLAVGVDQHFPENRGTAGVILYTMCSRVGPWLLWWKQQWVIFIVDHFMGRLSAVMMN